MLQDYSRYEIWNMLIGLEHADELAGNHKWCNTFRILASTDQGPDVSLFHGSFSALVGFHHWSCGGYPQLRLRIHGSRQVSMELFSYLFFLPRGQRSCFIGPVSFFLSFFLPSPSHCSSRHTYRHARSSFCIRCCHGRKDDEDGPDCLNISTLATRTLKGLKDWVEDEVSTC